MSPGQQLTSVFFDVLATTLGALLTTILDSVFTFIVNPLIEAVIAGLGLPTI